MSNGFCDKFLKTQIAGLTGHIAQAGFPFDRVEWGQPDYTTGNTGYLDQIEKCVFNAGLGAVTEDFRALQYFSCVNQTIADKTSNHCDYQKGKNG